MLLGGILENNGDVWTIPTRPNCNTHVVHLTAALKFYSVILLNYITINIRYTKQNWERDYKLATYWWFYI